MGYGHGPSGMVGITFNEKALDRWSKSLHISSLVEQHLLGLEGGTTNNYVTKHKEESLSQIKSDTLDRENIQKFIVTCIHAFSIEEHQTDIVNIHSGKLSTKEVNVDSCVSIGKQQVQRFIAALPNGFYNTLNEQASYNYEYS